MKKHLCRLFIFASFVGLFSFCTPYDSDKENFKLIQGQWMLADVGHAFKIYDTIKIDYSKDQTILIFEKDRCIEYMPDLNDTAYFHFSIHDYNLELFQKNTKINSFEIKQLTADSLTLQHETNVRTYIKIKGE